MKYFVFALVFVLASHVGSAQMEMGFDSTILVGKEMGIFNTRHIKIDQHNNKYLVGFFKGTMTIDTFSITTRPSITDSNNIIGQGIFLAKYDTNNQVKWLRKIAEGDSLYGCPMSIDKYGNQYFALSYRSLLYVGNDSIESQGSIDGVVLVYDSNNIIKYVNKIGGNNGDALTENEVQIDDNGNYYVSGVYNYTWSGVFANYQLTIGNDTLVANNQDIFIAKFDCTGTAIWAKSYGGGNGYSSEWIYSIVYANNNLYITGAGISSFNFGGINVTFPLNYTSKAILSKLDTNGHVLWVRKIGANDVVATMGMTSLSVQNNRVYVTGGSFSNTKNTFLFEGGNTLISPLPFSSGRDYFIACYDTAGIFKWNTISTSYGGESLAQLTTDSNSNLYAVGQFDYSMYFPNDTLYSYGADDAFVCSYDSMGNFRWVAGGGGAYSDIGSGIALDSHEKIFIVGGTTSSGGCVMGNDTLYPPMNQSTLFFSSLDSIVINHGPNGISSVESAQEIFNVFPNPAFDRVYISGKNLKGSDIGVIIYSYLGEKILQTTINNANNFIDISKQPDGVYMLKLITETRIPEIYPFIIHH